MSRPVWARINLTSLEHNLKRVKELTPGCKVLAVVKANAYGHGAAQVAGAISEQVDGFAVAGLGEARDLRAAGIGNSIHLLSGFHRVDELHEIAAQDLVPVIHTGWQVEQLARTRLPARITVWIKFDSGMHRLGFAPGDVEGVMSHMCAAEQVQAVRLMSHLACADDEDNAYTLEQVDLFDSVTRPHRCERSLANSAGICAWPRSHADWVRPGLMLYGCTPLCNSDETALGLRPVMSLVAELIAVHQLKQGDRVGYGGDWCCPEDMSVGVVACGYGDGYPRHAPSGTPVWVKGHRTQLVGRVSMDMLGVDLRSVPGAAVGDEVELWGRQVSATEVARAAGTISYELLSGVTARVPRTVG